MPNIEPPLDAPGRVHGFTVRAAFGSVEAPARRDRDNHCERRDRDRAVAAVSQAVQRIGATLFRDPGFAQALFGNNLFSVGQEEPQRTTQTSIDIVTSLNVGTEAASLLKNKEPLSAKEPVGSLIESVSVTPAADANIANIKATRSTPNGAAAVANAFANGYVIYRRDTDQGTSPRPKNS